MFYLNCVDSFRFGFLVMTCIIVMCDILESILAPLEGVCSAIAVVTRFSLHCMRKCDLNTSPF